MSVIVAQISSQWLDVYWVAAPVSLFPCAVMFSSWFGGPKPGLLATVLSVLIFKYYYLARPRLRPTSCKVVKLRWEWRRLE
jgi:K+-sensing histidine kinase KdpD